MNNETFIYTVSATRFLDNVFQGTDTVKAFNSYDAARTFVESGAFGVQTLTRINSHQYMRESGRINLQVYIRTLPLES